MEKRLLRSSNDVKLLGVCGGIAEYLNIDSTVVRLIMIALFFIGGSGLPIYFVCAIIMPKDDGFIM